jgi:hypothetical protein
VRQGDFEVLKSITMHDSAKLHYFSSERMVIEAAIIIIFLNYEIFFRSIAYTHIRDLAHVRWQPCNDGEYLIMHLNEIIQVDQVN